MNSWWDKFSGKTKAGNPQYVVKGMESEYRFEYPELFSERLLFRKILRTDRQAIFNYCSLPEVAQYMMWHRHRTLDDTDRFIDSVLDDYYRGRASSWGICLKNQREQMIGSIGFHNYDPKHRRIEVGYVLSPDRQGAGLMTEALLTLTDYAFLRLPVNRIQIQCLAENAASEKVMIKAGYHYEGIFREYQCVKERFHDVKQYALLKTDRFPE